MHLAFLPPTQMQLDGLCVSVTICEKDWTKVLLPRLSFMTFFNSRDMATRSSFPKQAHGRREGASRKCVLPWQHPALPGFLVACPVPTVSAEGQRRVEVRSRQTSVQYAHKSGFKESQPFKVTDDWIWGLYCCKKYQMKTSYSIVLENQKSFWPIGQTLT